jgi:hypothetical protein
MQTVRMIMIENRCLISLAISLHSSQNISPKKSESFEAVGVINRYFLHTKRFRALTSDTKYLPNHKAESKQNLPASEN